MIHSQNYSSFTKQLKLEPKSLPLDECCSPLAYKFRSSQALNFSISEELLNHTSKLPQQTADMVNDWSEHCLKNLLSEGLNSVVASRLGSGTMLVKYM